MIHYCTYVIPYLAQLQEQCESCWPRMCGTLSLLKSFGGSQNTFRTHRDMQLTRIGFTSGLAGATTCGGQLCAPSCAMRFFTGTSSSLTSSSIFTVFCKTKFKENMVYHSTMLYVIQFICTWKKKLSVQGHISRHKHEHISLHTSNHYNPCNALHKYGHIDFVSLSIRKYTEYVESTAGLSTLLKHIQLSKQCSSATLLLQSTQNGKNIPSFFNIPYPNKQNMGKWQFTMAGSMPVKVKYGKFCATVYIMQKCNSHNNRQSCHGFPHAYYSAPLILTLEHL